MLTCLAVLALVVPMGSFWISRIPFDFTVQISPRPLDAPEFLAISLALVIIWPGVIWWFARGKSSSVPENFEIEQHPSLSYATFESAGVDLRSTVHCLIPPRKTIRVPTNLMNTHDITPEGTAGLIFSRSGMAFKGIVVANGVGLIDSDYRGEIGVLLRNENEETFEIATGDRVAQLVIAPVIHNPFFRTEKSVRGAGGFGSTGTA
jgi:dUTP pyrophosphatase